LDDAKTGMHIHIHALDEVIDHFGSSHGGKSEQLWLFIGSAVLCVLNEILSRSFWE
jgi:hypothetical protein